MDKNLYRAALFLGIWASIVLVAHVVAVEGFRARPAKSDCYYFTEGNGVESSCLSYDKLVRRLRP